MIAPFREEEEANKEEVRPEIREDVAKFFAADGPFSRVASFDYEPRPQQARMADLVAEAIESGKHLAVEAGTGVGKSLAYLVPAIKAALQLNVQIVVSTYTISLQEQLVKKDLPLIQKLIGKPFRAVLAKGRSNYLCLRRLARARGMERDLFRPDDMLQVEQIRGWADGDAGDGSLQSMPFQPAPEVWSSVQVESGNCLWQRCPEYAQCYFMQARREIRNAHVVVVNHSLFFADLALRGQGASLLPDYRIAILDEAHQLEGVASQHLGIRLSQAAIEYWLRRLCSADSTRGLLVALREGKATHQVAQVRQESVKLFEQVDAWARFEQNSARVVPHPLELDTTLGEAMDILINELRRIHDDLEDLEKRAELSAARRRGGEIRMMLDMFLKQSLQDQVYWLQREGSRRKQTVMYSAPIEVGPHLREQLFKDDRAIIMTSATLAVNEKLDYFTKRIGAEEARAEAVGSPYDYARQMTLHIPLGMPDPGNTAAYLDASEKALHHYIDHSRGRAFVLCTNAKFMRDLHARTLSRFNDAGYAVFAQHEGLPRHAMLERFKNEPAGVLFGLDSFWMGVDVRGEALSNVIITRLPFAVPDEPVVKARMDRIVERGGDAFKEYSLPEAILKFRQGVGRLIRSSTDRGIVVILDPRIRTKWYGRYFLRALPDVPVEEDDIGLST